MKTDVQLSVFLYNAFLFLNLCSWNGFERTLILSCECVEHEFEDVGLQVTRAVS